MTQVAAKEAGAAGGGGEVFAALLSKYARPGADGSIVLILSSDDLTNIGALIAQALFGYLLNKEIEGGGLPVSTAAAAGVQDSQH